MYQYNKTIQKMINYCNFIKENINKNNSDWLRIPDCSYRILITGISGSQKNKK